MTDALPARFVEHEAWALAQDIVNGVYEDSVEIAGAIGSALHAAERRGRNAALKEADNAVLDLEPPEDGAPDVVLAEASRRIRALRVAVEEKK
jgi:hypothetical protein